MQRLLKNDGTNDGKHQTESRHCVEEGKWPQNLDFDCDDEGLGAFYQHSEICEFHNEIVREANSDFEMSLIRFNCRLRASAKPKYFGSVTLSAAVGTDSEIGSEAI